jgi:pimeloyl-ACP methyl ester carboxylesterase
MSIQASSSKTFIVFVHGFGSSKKIWDPLLELLRGDEAITSRFDFDCFGYPTSAFSRRLLQRIPCLKEIGENLKDYLDSEQFRNRNIILVGHSQGGLVIHAYIEHMLTRGQGLQLEPIRQVITFATPHYGSTTLSLLRRFVYWFVENPQERSLRVLDPDTAEIVGTVAQRAAGTREANELNWPIPVHCFGGLRDNVVLASSAKGPFTSYAPLEGDHSRS